MFEAIVTLVYTGDLHSNPVDGMFYPTTEVYRIEFDSEADMRQALDDMTRYTRVLNKEQLIGLRES